jgi:hypothetical protein
VRAANLGLKFLLELAAIAALAYAGSAVSIVLGIAAAVVVIVAWGRFAAPRSEHRLPRGPRIVFELAVFAAAAVALALAGAPVLGAVLAAVVALNAALMTAWDQWEA